MSRFIRLPLLVALVLGAVLSGATPAQARTGIHYVSIASTVVNPNPNFGERYIGDVTGDEGTNLVFRIYVSTDPAYPPRGGDIKVRYTTNSGTADEGVDFTDVNNAEVTIPEGSEHVDVSVPIVDDPYGEDTESFTVTLSNATNASIQDGEATGFIRNTGDPAPPELSVDDVALPEGDSGQQPFVFKVSLTGLVEQNVSVRLATKPGSAAPGTDYNATPSPTSLTFSPGGEMVKNVEVRVNGDVTVENDETFTVELETPKNARVAKASGTGTIQTDDLPKNQITTAPGRTGGPHVRIFDPNGTAFGLGFMAYEPAFTGGIRIARGDFVGNDGVQEIITAPCCLVPGVGGTASRPLVRVFSQRGDLLTQWFAYDQNFTGGVTIASGNVDPRQESPGDELVTAPGPGGGPHVRVWRIGSQPGENGLLPVFEINGFMAYQCDSQACFTSGVNVAVGNVVVEGPNDPAGAREEIVTTPMAGGGPHVQVNGIAVVNNQPRAYQFGWMAYDPAFTGGLSVAVGNFDSDTALEVVTGAGAGGGPHVKTFDVGGASGTERNLGFMAYNPAFRGGINVSAGNTQGSSATVDEIITGAGVGGGPHVQQFDASGHAYGPGFMAYDENFRGGVTVAYGAGE